MKILRLFNKISQALFFAFALSSVLLIISEIMMLTHGKADDTFSLVLVNLSSFFKQSISFVLCFFIVLAFTKGKREVKAFWCLFSLIACIVAMTAIFKSANEILLSIVISAFGIYCFEKFDGVFSMPMLLFFSIIFGVLTGFLYELFNDYLAQLSQSVSDKGIISSVLFSVVDGLSTIIDGSLFREIFFTKSPGGAVFYNGEIITGVKDLFKEGYRGRLVSAYLSGHYFTLFAAFGMAYSLFSKLKNQQKYSLIFTASSAIFSGNIYLFSLFLFLQSPFLFFGLMLLNILSYITAYLMNITVGYIYNGSLIEMLINIRNPLYIIAVGIIFICLGYFLTNFITEKHCISDFLNIYIPKDLTDTVENLGGVGNIIRLKDNRVEVRNIKLINTLKLECKLEENEVEIDNDIYSRLSEYI